MIRTSSVALVSLSTNPAFVGGRDRQCELVNNRMMVPLVTGNFLIASDVVKLDSPRGETLIIAAPFLDEEEVRIHLAFGTMERRVGHTIDRDGLKLIIDNLQLMLDVANAHATQGE